MVKRREPASIRFVYAASWHCLCGRAVLSYVLLQPSLVGNQCSVLPLSLSLCCWLVLYAGCSPSPNSLCHPSGRPVSLAAVPAKLPRIMRLRLCGHRRCALPLPLPRCFSCTHRPAYSVCLSVSLSVCLPTADLVRWRRTQLDIAHVCNASRRRSCTPGTARQSARFMCGADVAVAGKYDRHGHSSTHYQYQWSVRQHSTQTRVDEVHELQSATP